LCSLRWRLVAPPRGPHIQAVTAASQLPILFGAASSIWRSKNQGGNRPVEGGLIRNTYVSFSPLEDGAGPATEGRRKRSVPASTIGVYAAGHSASACAGRPGRLAIMGCPLGGWGGRSKKATGSKAALPTLTEYSRIPAKSRGRGIAAPVILVRLGSTL